MNKIKSIILLVFSLIILTACGSPSTKYDSVIYENNDMPGLKSNVAFDYDNEDNIQKVVMTSEYIYEEVQMSKDELKKNYDDSVAANKDIKGVERSADFTDDKMTETVTIVVKNVPKKELTRAFPTMVKDDNVSLNTYTTILKQSGYSKK